ncbi:prolyl-tRNA synthetase associated domain-containing protein [Limosilactobacillus sp.]|jgi:Ala-tRNA(Pro) deacylase|uniref:prolyl-tRNA synthetase associated domain-containing protein n=1 Tax=Limosilactobacillus sp. TaxID=2773925 RepID=UPI0035A0167F
MSAAQKVLNQLKRAHISYKLIHHPAVYTASQADQFVQGEEFARTKNLFLTTDKHQHYYLLLLADNKRLDQQRFRSVTHAPRVSFASLDDLQAKLGLTPGAVSPFGLLNNTEHDVILYVDQTVVNASRIGCHPNDNTMTVILKTNDLWKFLEKHGFPVHVIKL